MDNLEKTYSLYNKADERLMLSCFGVDADMSDVRGDVYRKLKDKILDMGGKTLNGFGRQENVAYNVKLISDENGVRCDKRTLPKDLKPWIDCPYDMGYFCDAENLAHGVYRCVISYSFSGGTYEYPNECDMYLTMHRCEKKENQ